MEEELHHFSGLIPLPMKGNPYSSFQDVFLCPTTSVAAVTTSLAENYDSLEAIEQCEEGYNLMLISNPLPSCSSSLHPFELEEHVFAVLDHESQDLQ